MENNKKEYFSVALCTYNGALYLPEQLNSIAAQTRLPDELVICDDQSTDTTRDIITEFSLKVSFPVHFYINSNRLGSTKNFEKAIKLCRGTIIVLSDQDDYWYPDRLQCLEASFSEFPDVSLVFSNAAILNEKENLLEKTLWDSFQFNKKEQKIIKKGNADEVLIKHSIVTGATMAFRNKYNEILLPIPEEFIHDNWISLLLASISNFAIIDKPLIKYRQHSNQQVGPGDGKLSFKQELAISKKTSRIEYQKEIEFLISIYNRLKESNNIFRVSSNTYKMLNKKIQHRQFRMNLPDNKLSRLRIVSVELIKGRYHSYSNGFKSFSKDLFFK